MKKNIIKIISVPIITTYSIYYYFYFNYVKHKNVDIYKFI